MAKTFLLALILLAIVSVTSYKLGQHSQACGLTPATACVELRKVIGK